LVIPRLKRGDSNQGFALASEAFVPLINPSMLIAAVTPLLGITVATSKLGKPDVIAAINKINEFEAIVFKVLR
jgi:hypothetical protein